MSRRILVTGGAGFIGSNFVCHLLDNHPDDHVVVLDALTYAGNPRNFPARVAESPRFEFWQGTVRNGALVQRLMADADVVVHMAAETHVARSIYDDAVFFETDVLGSQTMATAALRHKDQIDRFIHVSSSEVYGSAMSEVMTEDHPLNPTTPYAAAKAGADRLMHAYYLTYGLPVVIVRPFNNYGPRQHLEKLIPRFVTSALNDEPLTVHGEGRQSRDWLFVADHCEALDRLLEAPLETVKGEVINLGTGVSASVREIADLVVEKVGADPELIEQVPDRPGQVQRHTAGTEKATRLLDWEPATKLKRGLERTIEWYASNKEWWESMLWMKAEPKLGGVKEWHPKI